MDSWNSLAEPSDPDGKSLAIFNFSPIAFNLFSKELSQDLVKTVYSL